MKFLVSLAILGVSFEAVGQSIPRSFKLDAAALQDQPSSNSIGRILINNGIIYVATGQGLNVLTDEGKTFKTDWGPGGPTGVSTMAIAIEGDTIAVSSNPSNVMNIGGSTALEKIMVLR